MRMNQRTLSAAVFAGVLMLSVSACKKKVPAPPPPPPVVVTPPAPPTAPAARITNFSVEPRAIQTGQSATLTWSVANATDISIDNGIGSVAANGTRQVFPTTTTTYTLTASAAGGNDTRSVTVDVSAPPPPPPPPPAKPRITGGQEFSTMFGADNGDALFDYDKSDIRDDARQALTSDAAKLKQIFSDDPSFTVVLEGHCDERGSAEYNLGLGDRRATAAKDFLVQLGVPAEKVRTISYGKDRPICTDATEACYQRNRRAHLAPAQ
jgi:peptidoglycan-associated lipoprotein